MILITAYLMSQQPDRKQDKVKVNINTTTYAHIYKYAYFPTYLH